MRLAILNATEGDLIRIALSEAAPSSWKDGADRLVRYLRRSSALRVGGVVHVTVEEAELIRSVITTMPTERFLRLQLVYPSIRHDIGALDQRIRDAIESHNRALAKAKAR